MESVEQFIARYAEYREAHRAKAQQHQINAKEHQQLADEYQACIDRLKHEQAGSIVTVVREGKPDQIAACLGNGRRVFVSIRVVGEYKDRGFWLDRLPEGFEWAVVRDKGGESVLITRPAAPKVAEAGSSSSYTCGQGIAPSCTPDDRYSDKGIENPIAKRPW